jgi:hypothetical protein
MTQPAKSREVSVYDGQECIGTIKVNNDGQARAFDARGNRLGSFPSLTAACAAFKPSEQAAPQP